MLKAVNRFQGEKSSISVHDSNIDCSANQLSETLHNLLVY